MKYKKYSYIIVLMLMLLVGINRTYAYESKTCYYMSEDSEFKARLTINWKERIERKVIGSTLSAYAPITIEKMGENNYTSNSEGIINWWKSWNLYRRKECITGDSVCFEFRYKNRAEAEAVQSEPSCPQYTVLEDTGKMLGIAVWATDSSSKAQSAQTTIRNNGYTGYYGKLVDETTYYAEWVDKGIVIVGDDGKYECSEEYEAIFGSKDDPESIRYMINTALQYVRIIVPILIIVLGSMDFAKAVLAGKEDNMRKAQSDFIKRVLIGVAVFFVPLLVDLVMWLADIVWAGEYIHCDL